MKKNYYFIVIIVCFISIISMNSYESLATINCIGNASNCYYESVGGHFPRIWSPGWCYHKNCNPVRPDMADCDVAYWKVCKKQEEGNGGGGPGDPPPVE